MTSKKGLSDAEKRTRMSEIFLSVHTLPTPCVPSNVIQGEFFTYKEIEKIATQQKKIVLQSVKDVLQSLVDDRLVHSSFPYLVCTAPYTKRSRLIKSAQVSITGPSHPMSKDPDKHNWNN
jgi:hypothetical protein